MSATADNINSIIFNVINKAVVLVDSSAVLTVQVVLQCFRLTNTFKATISFNIFDELVDSLWHPPPPEEAGASSCKSKQSVLVRAVHWLQHKRANPVCPTVLLALAMRKRFAFLHFWYWLQRLRLCRDVCHIQGNPMLLCWDSLFLCFCIHSMNKADCLQRICLS